MSKYWIFVLAAVAVLLVASLVLGSRLAAGGGAVLLIGAIIYATVRTQTNTRGVAQADAGAKRLREQLEAEDARD